MQTTLDIWKKSTLELLDDLPVEPEGPVPTPDFTLGILGS